MLLMKLRTSETQRCWMVYMYCAMCYLVLVLSVGQVMSLKMSISWFEEALKILDRSEEVTMLTVASIDALSASIIALLTSTVVWSQLYINQRSLSVCRFLTFLNFLAILQFILELDTMIFLMKINNSQLKTHGFKRMMHKYGEDLSYKVLMDTLQVDFECCGNNNFKDWLQIPWVDGGRVSREIPYSCCKRKEISPCNHRDVLTTYQQTKTSHNLSSMSIYTRGCNKVFIKTYSFKVLYFVCLPSALKCILLVLMIAVLRYIITSIKSFMENPDINLSNNAYLMSAFEYEHDEKKEESGRNENV